MFTTRRQKLDHLMKHPTTDAVVMVLILGSITLLVLSMSLPPGHSARAKVDLLSHLVTMVFGLELSLRWLAEPKKRKFFERFWIDCIAVLPALRWFRFLWLLRLLRIFRFGVLLTRRLSGYSALVRQGAVESVIFLVVVTGVVLAAAFGVRAAEGANMGFDTLSESVWWSVLSLVAGEPVGQTPSTTAGKLVTVGVMFSGLTMFAVVTGIVSANMVDRLRNLNLRDMEIEDLDGHAILCGWNPAALLVIREMQADPQYGRRGIVVIAEFDKDPDLTDVVPQPGLVFFVHGDYTRPDVLHRAHIERASRAIILADRTRERSDQDRDARSVLTALLIENINQQNQKDIFTSVELVNRDNAQSLVSAGVEEIVVAHDYVGRILASSSRQVGMTPIFDELLTASYGNQFLKFILPGAMPPLTVRELSRLLQDRCQAILLAVERPGSYGAEMQVNPPQDRIVGGGEVVVAIAETPIDPRVLL